MFALGLITGMGIGVFAACAFTIFLDSVEERGQRACDRGHHKWGLASWPTRQRWCQRCSISMTEAARR